MDGTQMDITRCAIFFIYLHSCSLTDLQQPSFIPAQLEQEHTPLSANPTIIVEPPRSYHRAHQYTSSLTFHQVLSLHPPPLVVYALAQAASMTPHILLLDRNPFLNDHAMTIPITISGPSLRKYPLLLLPSYLLTLHRQPPCPADVSLTLTHTHPCNNFRTSSNRSTTAATSSSIPFTNHILTLIPA
jgi:hypothetical protein